MNGDSSSDMSQGWQGEKSRMLQVGKLRPRRDSLPKDHKAYSEQNQHEVRGGGVVISHLQDMS